MSNSIRMTENEARLIMREFFVLEVSLGHIAQILEKTELGAQSPIMTSALQLSYEIYQQIARPIVSIYPQFNPDEDPLRKIDQELLEELKPN